MCGKDKKTKLFLKKETGFIYPFIFQVQNERKAI